MAKQDHLDILDKGVDAWNEWARTTKEGRIDLSEADLSNRQLPGIQLVGAYLVGTNLDNAHLEDANLLGADLSRSSARRANFSHADLTNSDLGNADFTGADFSKANLIRAKAVEANLGAAFLETILCWADLTGADFKGAAFGATILGDTNLSRARNLDACTHWLPSIIDHQTIARSGELPSSFLRGCGLPDALIEYFPSLISPVEFYSCVISYSVNDQQFAEQLHHDLTRAGIRCWFAPQALRIGEPIANEINEAIKFYDKMLVVLSESSIRSSWVEKEIEIAFQKENEQQVRVLFPVRLDGSIMEATSPLLSRVREYYIANFSDWKSHQSYKKELSKLIRDLTFSFEPEGVK
jgi:hypothetical protein